MDMNILSIPSLGVFAGVDKLEVLAVFSLCVVCVSRERKYITELLQLQIMKID
jgi:hypothetical protein